VSAVDAMSATEPRIRLEQIGFVGAGLVRPECVLAHSSGALFCADWRGGVARVGADGRTRLIAAPDGGRITATRPLRPNGIAMRRDGSFLLADLGEDLGGVFHLRRDGSMSCLVDRIDGVDLPPSNFVHEDDAGRIWITVSTRHRPRAAAYRADIADGFVALLDAHGARIVADGLVYTNEALPSPDGRWLYVNETFARRLVRFPLRADGGLGSKETVTTFGAGTFPDGLAFDSENHVWIVSIVSNRVLRVAPDGAQQLMIEDADAAHLAWVEEAFQSATMGRPHLDRAAGRVLKNISSIAFGGPDLRTAYLGCLLGDRVAFFQSPVAGHAPVHWSYPTQRE
jgi:sugar lactone lactonase YvrE